MLIFSLRCCSCLSVRKTQVLLLSRCRHEPARIKARTKGLKLGIIKKKHKGTHVAQRQYQTVGRIKRIRMFYHRVSPVESVQPENRDCFRKENCRERFRGTPVNYKMYWYIPVYLAPGNSDCFHRRRLDADAD